VSVGSVSIKTRVQDVDCEFKTVSGEKGLFITDYANEMEMVHQFIRYTHRHRVQISPQRSLHFLVWGYEFWMPEGGRDGGSGSIDLLATDDEGHAWLIEAKREDNPELNPNLFWICQQYSVRPSGFALVGWILMRP
jgi:hypothetical protein